VHSIDLTATTCSDDLKSASIFGRATIDGSGMFVFRIDVIDNGAYFVTSWPRVRLAASMALAARYYANVVTRDEGR
jgi:hypothetical protein